MKLSEILAGPGLKHYDVAVTLLSDMCVGSGSGGQEWVDRAFVRDGRRLPYLPGSHLKGVVRHAAEMLAPLMGERTCHAPRPDSMCPRDEDPGFCIVCRIFGSPRLPSALIFGSLAYGSHGMSGTAKAVPNPDLVGIVRYSVSMDRWRRTAKEQRLFTTEVVPAGATFAGTLRLTRHLDENETLLLRRAFAWVDQLGGGESTGRGRVTITLTEARRA